MQVTLEIPDDLAAHFGNDGQAISRAVLEALAAHGVRTRSLSEAEARRLLGLSRYEMDGFLKARGIDLDMTYEEVMEGVENSRRFRAAQAACVS